MTTEQLHNSILSSGSMLCVGLDSDPARLPSCVRSADPAADVLAFNKAIIDATSPFCIAYKPNIAFYEAMGASGWKTLEATVGHIRDNHPGKFIIADAKRGDIGNTARMYARTFFESLDFDAVTISPYMGVDAVEPFLSYPGRYAIVVALSSNPGSEDFEQKFIGDRPVYQVVMERMMEISTPENMMFVVGATKADKLREIRSFCPDNFFLVPGVGAQGGSAGEVISNGANRRGGLLINSSRAILYASSGEDFAGEAARIASLTARCR